MDFGITIKPDITIDRIADLTTYDMPALLDAARQKRTR